MKISDAFPSAFLKAEDLAGKNVTVTISDAVIEEVGQGRDKERKLILSFHGKEKKLIVNKTNAGTISKLYGDDTDNWMGQRITLCPREVEFQGDMVWAIRVSLTKPVASVVAAPVVATPPPKPVMVAEEVSEEEIPF